MPNILIMKRWHFLFNVEYTRHNKKIAFAIKVKFRLNKKTYVILTHIRIL